MADTEREPQNNSLEDVAAAASRTLPGQTVSVEGSAARHIDAGQVKMQASSAFNIQTHAANVQNSAVAFVNAGAVDAQESAIGLVVGKDVQLKKSATPVIVAGKVKASDVRTVFLMAGRVQGKVQTVFTVWSALAAGFGLGAALLGLGKLFASQPAPSRTVADKAKPREINPTSPGPSSASSKATSRR